MDILEVIERERLIYLCVYLYVISGYKRTESMYSVGRLCMEGLSSVDAIVVFCCYILSTGWMVSDMY